MALSFNEMSRSKSKRKGIRILAVIGVLISTGMLILMSVAQSPRFIHLAGEHGIVIQTDDLKPGSVKFYSYRDRAGEQLRFLLARDSDGDLYAAMDACHRCYSYHEGYATSDGYLICKLCGNRYKLAMISKGLASCVPVMLRFKAEGQTAKIDTAELEHNHYLF